MSLLAMLASRFGMLLRLFMLAKIVKMGGLMMVMCGRVVVCGGLMMMLTRRMLRLCHGAIPPDRSSKTGAGYCFDMTLLLLATTPPQVGGNREIHASADILAHTTGTLQFCDL